VLLDHDLQAVVTVVGGRVVFDAEKRFAWKS